MVALSVDVEDFIVWFHERLVGSTWKVEGYVKEVYGFLICFDGFLFRLHKFFLQMIINFSKRHNLHLLLTLL